MKKLMICSLLVVVLVLGFGLYLGQTRNLNATGTLSVKEMGKISAGEAGEAYQNMACNANSGGCGYYQWDVCVSCTFMGIAGCGHYYALTIFCLPSVHRDTIAHKVCGYSSSSTCMPKAVRCEKFRSCGYLAITDPPPSEPPYYYCTWNEWGYNYAEGCY